MFLKLFFVLYRYYVKIFTFNKLEDKKRKHKVGQSDFSLNFLKTDLNVQQINKMRGLG